MGELQSITSVKNVNLVIPCRIGKAKVEEREQIAFWQIYE
jgi:hypothetical protein